MLTRLPSVSKNETYRPTLGISMGSPSTWPPASVTRRIAASTSSTQRTTDVRWPVGIPSEEAAINRPRAYRAALIPFGGRGKDIVAHLLPKHLCLPAKRVLVELRHALAIVVGHFEVYDRAHLAHYPPLADCSKRCRQQMPSVTLDISAPCKAGRVAPQIIG